MVIPAFLAASIIALLHFQALQNGDQVHIITKQEARPQAIWLNTVKSSKARSAIHHALKTHQQQDAIDLGKRMLARTLAGIGTSIEDIPEQQLEAVCIQLQHPNLDALLSR